MHNDQPVNVNLSALTKLFYLRESDLGRFTEISAEQMPDTYRKLLAHENHMTVTVEAHHRSPVDVVVLDRSRTASHYARKIVLCRQSDHVVVQFGLVRINWQYVSEAVKAAIQREDTPLGRILIEHNVLRSIHLVSLYRIEPGKEMRHFFGIDPGESKQNPRTDDSIYGRTAIILCNEEPAIELLEIVAPEPAHVA